LNWRAILAIVRKDITVVRRSRAILIPLLAIPLLVLIVLPLLITLLASNASAVTEVTNELNRFIAQMPDGMRENLSALETDAERLIVLVTIYMLAPLYLIIPLTVAAVIAADSFVGEKERKTLEALFYAPIPDRDLLIGKLLSAWIPAMSVGIGGFVLYGVLINIAAWPVMGHLYFPTTMWLLLVFWVGPAMAGLGLGSMVLVSSKVRTFQEAAQLGGVVILPLILLVSAQASGLLYFSTVLVAGLGLVIWIINALLLVLAIRHFRREEVLIGSS
jgi:ABC-2 type transport system permease protein